MGEPRFDVGGYVLAGGRSSRMGRDKALLELGGRTLTEHAVAKLRRFCADVHVLSAREELARFAPLVPDLHEGCGPLGGIEAALAHSRHKWNLFVPVDVPFLPGEFLRHWAERVEALEKEGARLAIFTVDGVAQPVPCLLHIDVLPYATEGVEEGVLKLFPLFESTARDLADQSGLSTENVFLNWGWDEGESSLSVTGQKDWNESKGDARHLWFVNLNTPEEFAEAERFASALEG